MANKRYKILDGALEYLAFGDTATDVTLPANTPLRKFQEWRNNEREVNYERLEQSLPGSISEVGVNPFAMPLDGTAIAKAPISQRVLDLNSLADTRGAANVITAVPSTARNYENFEPAKAIVTLPFNDPRTETPTSQLTGLKYNRANKTSYTIPYGKKTGTLLESEVRAEIVAAVNAIAGASVRFKSEKI